MSKALYRTYRSRSFDEIVGQSHVTDLLKNAILTGKIAHAYLLTGPRGVGKTSVARIIAHAVNGLDYSEDPHLDIIEIDAASNRRIDDIRDLREKVHISPVKAAYKVYIIDEVHMLTGESFNALLKTLEEPPAHVIFILATTEVHKVPATIISRTQRFHFRPASASDIISHLKNIAAKESIAVDDSALELIAIHAGGSFRDSVSLLDQLSGVSEKITEELVESVLGMAPRTHIEAILTAVVNHKVTDLIDLLNETADAGVSPVTLTDQLSRSLLHAARTHHGLYALLDELADVPRAHNPEIKLLAVLVRYAKPPSPHKTVASEIPRAPSVAAKPAALRSMIDKRTKAPDSPIDKALPAKQKKVQEPAHNSQGFDWQLILATIKKHYPALFSVLSRAEIDYDEAAHTLTLTFVYALHRKKLENPTYKKQLGSVIADTCHISPELIITDVKSSASLDDDAQAVAAIMGGGEPVRGTI